MIKNESTTRTKIEELKDLYCDSYKDVHGIKARWVYGMDLTLEELENMMARLEEAYAFNQEDVARVEAANEAKARERIQALIEHGAKNVVRAIRWLHEAEGTDGDDRFLDFTLGTRYGFIDEVLQKGL